MAYSKVVTSGDGSTTIFAVNFALDYLLEADVTCRVGDEEDGSGDPIYRDITFVDTNLIEVLGAVPGDDVQIVFERTVDKDELRVDFNDGDVLDEDNLMIAQKQAMMAVHEVLDGRFNVMTQDLDMGEFQIKNLADPTDDLDAANKQYVDERVPPGQVSADAALASQLAAAASAAAAAASEAVLATAQDILEDAEAAAAAAAALVASLPTSTTLRAVGKRLYWDGSTHKYAYLPPTEQTVDLRDFMDAHYGVGSWTYRTTIGSGSDCTPALNAAKTALGGYGRIMVTGEGFFAIKTAPADLSGVLLEGATVFSAGFVVSLSAGVAFAWSGIGGYSAGGMKKISVYLEDGMGTTTAYALAAIAGLDYGASRLVLEDLWIDSLNAANATWYTGILLNGIAKTVPYSQGIREPSLRNIVIFGCGTGGHGLDIRNVVQATVSNVGVFASGSLGNSININGGGTSGTNSQQISLERVTCGGTLSILNCNRVSLSGSFGQGGVITDSTATYVSGFVEGTVSGSFGSNSNVTVLG